VVENNIFIFSGSIILDGLRNSRAISNIFTDSEGIIILCENLKDWNSHYIINNSNIDGKPIYYYKNEYGIVIPNDAGQLILENCNSCIIKDLSIKGGFYGIQLGFSNDNNISSNDFYENKPSSISCFSSSNNIIAENFICNNLKDGIEFTGQSCSNNIYSNLIENCLRNGILLKASGNKLYNNIY
jgi:parallel beta-helix repeat protein